MNASPVRRALTPPVRVGLSMLAIVVTLIALPSELRRVARWLIAFNVGAAVFLALLIVSITGAGASEVRARSRSTDRSAGRVLVAAIVAGATGLSAVGFVLRAATG